MFTPHVSLLSTTVARWLIPATLSMVPVLSAQASTEALNQSEKKVMVSHQQSAVTQRKIDRLENDSQEIYQEYQHVMRQAETTEAYNRQLMRLTQSQQGEITSLQSQIESIEDTDRALLPMLVRMVNMLDKFVASDTPFLPEERQQRVERLQSLMDRADVSLAEKYRQILQAYRIEIDYGRTLEAYEGTVETTQGERQVTFLRLGRVALYFQSADGQISALWQPAERQWQTLAVKDNVTLKQAIRMARQQVIPELLNLPLPDQEADA
ncbi:DUF3450 domain-containing protein [Oceanospirillum sediminis]|uniref:DUF3450 domain-containing protein n=1 Tax=Oceanospirillum sediminis TaxID=2760088 RepID=A0A839IM25_9GAMM|nr:DUF3450 domain-containing protein [Oceanospirillum sediminis]MBB1485941.1 DUF3450 domain-containing protein [Oceanospirillum sediminis]